MRDLLVITPTRGRLASIIRLTDALKRTCTADTQLVLGVDDDDPSYDDAGLDCWVERGPRRSCADWSNRIVLLHAHKFRYLASVSDDHLPETPGWDSQLIEVIEENGGTGIAYGNDMLQGPNLPTTWVMSADIVKALGWMYLPTSSRLFCDNVLLDLGRAAECLYYLPDVTVRHLHYSSGLSSRDQTAIDGEGWWQHDEAAYHTWQRERAADDLATVKALLSYRM